MGFLKIGRKFPVLQTLYLYCPLFRSRTEKRMLRNLTSTMKEVVDQQAGDLAPDERKKLEADIADCAKKFHMTPIEYFIYHFENKTDEERGEFFAQYDRMRFLFRANNWLTAPIFIVKSKTAKKFAKYFKRTTLELTLPRDAKKLEKFIAEHKSIILKPVNTECGQGVRKLIVDEKTDVAKAAQEMVDAYCGKSGALYKIVVEDLIIQDERMAKFHPQSVNTLRVVTIRMNDRVVISNPRMRVGCGDSVVDNGGSGGIICSLDPETGVVVASVNEKGEPFAEHPDTHERLLDFQVPRFAEAIALTKEMAYVVPACRYIGWDLALTKDGWVVVEANYKPSVFGQAPLQKGCKREFFALAKELGFDLEF